MEVEKILEKFYKDTFGLKFISISRFLGVYLLTIDRVNRRLSNSNQDEILFNKQIPSVNIPWDINDFLAYAGTVETWNKSILSERIDFKTETPRKKSKKLGTLWVKFIALWPSIMIDVVKNKRIFAINILRGFLPIKSSFFCINKAFMPDFEQRLRLKNYLLKNGIDNSKALIISRSLPIVYLEGFKYYYKIFGDKERKLVTSYAHFSNYILHYLSAFNNSTKLFIYEHGTESLNKWNDYFDYEFSVATRFYGLSRAIEQTQKYRWFRDLNFTKSKIVRSDSWLMVTVNMPKYSLDDRSMPNSNDFKSYQESVLELGTVLSTRTKLVHRPYFKNEGWNEMELSRFGHWPIDTRPMNKLLNDYGVFVITYPGSLWLELIRKGKVVILVWDYLKYPLRDNYLEEELIRNKILFRDSKLLISQYDYIMSNANTYPILSCSLIKRYFER